MRDEDLIAWERNAYLMRQRRKRLAAKRKAQSRRRLLVIFLLGALLTIILIWGNAGGAQEQMPAELCSSELIAAPAVIKPEAQEPIQQEEEAHLSYLGEFHITHYCACQKCCGKSEDDPWYGITATGTVATEGRTIAVDPSVIPYGSEVAVVYDDGRVCHYIAEDCGGAIKGNDIDVFIADHKRALEMGVTSASVYVVEKEDLGC